MLNRIKHVIKCFRNKELYKQLKLLDSEESVLLFGSPLYWNEGDQAIAVAEHRLWEKYIKNKNLVDIPRELWEQKKDIICSKNINNRPVFFTGGGYIGDVWNDEQLFVEDVLHNFKNNPIVFFPQTVYFKENANFQRFIDLLNSNKNVLFFARDSKTYEKMKRFESENLRVLFVPDVVLSMSETNASPRTDKVLVCLREDLEGIRSKDFAKKIREIITANNCPYFDYTTARAKYVKLKDREKCYHNAITNFQKSKCVVTDRLHGMLLATITGTPVLFFDNLSHKVSLTYEWIKELDYVIDGEKYADVEAGVKECLILSNNNNYKYLPEKLEKYYTLLFDEIREHIEV